MEELKAKIDKLAEEIKSLKTTVPDEKYISELVAHTFLQITQGGKSEDGKDDSSSRSIETCAEQTSGDSLENGNVSVLPLKVELTTKVKLVPTEMLMVPALTHEAVILAETTPIYHNFHASQNISMNMYVYKRLYREGRVLGTAHDDNKTRETESLSRKIRGEVENFHKTNSILNHRTGIGDYS